MFCHLCFDSWSKELVAYIADCLQWVYLLFSHDWSEAIFHQNFFLVFYFRMILELYQSFTNSPENPEVLLLTSLNVGILMAPAQATQSGMPVYWVPHRPF